MKTAISGVVLLLAGLLPPDEPIAWEVSLPKALAEAKARNAPLILLMTQDKDPGSEQTLSLYRSRKVQDFAGRIVFVAGHNGLQHEAPLQRVGGKEVAICSLFQVPCEEHVKSWDAMRQTYHQKEFWPPVQIFLFPDGRESFRFQKNQEAKFVLGEIERVLKGAGPGIDRSEYKRLLAEIEKAREDAKAGKVESGRKRILAAIRKNHPEPTKRFLEESAAGLK